MYTYESVLASTQDYFSGQKLQADVSLNKYLLRDKSDVYHEQTPDDMHKRMASEFARIDRDKYKNQKVDFDKLYYEAMSNFARVVPQGSPMAAIGNPFQTMSASNCVVIESPADSIDGIMKAATEIAQLSKRRCGVGVDISHLRPNGMAVNNAARTTSGPCSFADLFSYVTRMIGQGGRRGALMVTIDVHHPDVEEFAKMKSDLGLVTGANVSIRLSDKFMKAVDNNEEYEQYWPMEGKKKISRKVSARKVWETIIDYATKTAEPGLIFWDTMTKLLPAHQYPRFKSVSTNPCSEICLSPNDSCRLISINLTGYVLDPFVFPSFDWELFKKDVALATRMADNLVDLELELVSQIMSICGSKDEVALWKKMWQAGHDGRRTGLGTHGLADMLAQLCIKYDSEEALEFCDELYRVFRDTAYWTSVELAKERGPYPAFDWSILKNNEFIKGLPRYIYDGIKEHGIRNISLLTQAPTGTTSLVSKVGQFDTYGVSSGVEPVWRILSIRRKKINPGDKGTRVDYVDDTGDSWQEYEVYHPNVLNYIKVICDSENLEGEEREKREKELANNLPDYFVTSDQIDWRFRVKLQGVEQKYIDHSISSTINLPKGTSPEVVAGIYMEAWKNGLKGITVYVDGSRSGVLVTKEENEKPRLDRRDAPKRPKILPCDIHRTKVRGDEWTVFVGLLDGEPYEVFGGPSDLIDIPRKHKVGFLVKKSKGKYGVKVNDEMLTRDIAGLFDRPELSWATRLISTSLRHGTPLEFMVEQLNKVGNINDFNKAIARVLKRYIKNGEKVKSSVKCPSCGDTNFVWQEGCALCNSCGYSKC